MDSEVSSVFMNSLISSSHLFRGLPTDLFVLMQLSRPGSHSAVLLDHRSSGRGAILIAILHFILLCVQFSREYLLSSFALLLPLCFFLCFQSNRVFGSFRSDTSNHTASKPLCRDVQLKCCQNLRSYVQSVFIATLRALGTCARRPP